MSCSLTSTHTFSANDRLMLGSGFCFAMSFSQLVSRCLSRRRAHRACALPVAALGSQLALAFLPLTTPGQLLTAAPSGGFPPLLSQVPFLFSCFSCLSVCLCTVCVYCHKGTFSDPYSCGDGHSEGPYGRTGLFPSSEFIMGRRGYDQRVSFYLKNENCIEYSYLVLKCSVGLF